MPSGKSTRKATTRVTRDMATKPVLRRMRARCSDGPARAPVTGLVGVRATSSVTVAMLATALLRSTLEYDHLRRLARDVHLVALVDGDRNGRAHLEQIV